MDAALQRMIHSTTASWTVDRYKRLLQDLTTQQPELAVALVLGDQEGSQTTSKKRKPDDAPSSKEAKRPAVKDNEPERPTGKSVDPNVCPPLPPIPLASYSASLNQHLAEIDNEPLLASDRKNRLKVIVVLAHQFDWTGKTQRAFFDYVQLNQSRVILPPGTEFSPMTTERSVGGVIRHAKTDLLKQVNRWLSMIPATKSTSTRRHSSLGLITFDTIVVKDWPASLLTLEEQRALVRTRARKYRQDLSSILGACGLSHPTGRLTALSEIFKPHAEELVLPETLMDGLVAISRIGLNMIAARPRELLEIILEIPVFVSFQIATLVLVRELRDTDAASIRRMLRNDDYADLIPDFDCVRARSERSVDVSLLSEAIKALERLAK